MSSPGARRIRYYDGGIYARLMDPMLSGLRGYLAKLIEPQQRILDAGCGTGALAFRLADSAEHVVGIDRSPAMIAHAEQRLRQTGPSNLSFAVGDVTEVVGRGELSGFHLATLIMVLHEMPADVRGPVLSALCSAAESVLCVDFRVPMPRNLAGLRNRFFEVAAGREHFRAFRDFTRRGGTQSIAEAIGLECEHVRYLDKGTLEVHRIRARATLT